MQPKKQKMHYAWLILIACCMMQGAGLGLVSNCAGVYYSSVCADLGFEMGKFTFYRMLFNLSQAFMMPFVAKSFKKMDVRVIVSAATAIMGICSILLGASSELWQFYIVGIIQGAAAAFVGMVPAPILLANWFHKKTGTAVGIAAAFSGFVGMLGSSALGVTIPAFGWRASYMLMGVVVMVLILPFSVFVLHYRPEDIGMLPYGADETYVRATESAKAAEKEKLTDFLKQPLFYVALIAYAATIIGACLNAFLTSCGVEAGLTLTLAAMLTTLSLFGNMFSKFFLGKFCDTYGVIKVFIISIVISEIGHLLLFMGIPMGMMPGAFLYGITMPFSTVMLPLFCRLFWKGDTYATAYSYVSMFGMLLSSPFNMLFGTFYDMTGTYHLSIAVSAAFIVLVLVLVVATDRILKKSASQAR